MKKRFTVEKDIYNEGCPWDVYDSQEKIYVASFGYKTDAKAMADTLNDAHKAGIKMRWEE